MLLLSIITPLFPVRYCFTAAGWGKCLATLQLRATLMEANPITINIGHRKKGNEDGEEELGDVGYIQMDSPAIPHSPRHCHLQGLISILGIDLIFPEQLIKPSREMTKSGRNELLLMTCSCTLPPQQRNSSPPGLPLLPLPPAQPPHPHPLPTFTIFFQGYR